MGRFMMVISGETFRHDPFRDRPSDFTPHNFPDISAYQGNRTRGTEESFKLQNFATTSQLDFIKNIDEKYGLECDVCLFYYKLNEVWDNHFESNFYPHLKYTIKLDTLLGEENLHTMMINYIKSNIDISLYEFILFIIPDLYLKKYFSDIFEIDYDRIKFAHVNEITDHLGKSYHEQSGFPLVNHQIFYVPKNFYDSLLSHKIWKNHYSYIEAIKNGFSPDKIGFFLETYHSSSTSNTWNPIFHQVGRYESKFWVDQNFILDSQTHKPKNQDYDNRYSSLIGNDFTDNYYA